MPDPLYQTDDPATLPPNFKPSAAKVLTLNGLAVSEEWAQRTATAFRTGTNAAHDASTGAGDTDAGTQRVVEAADSPLTVAAEAIRASVENPTNPTGAATAANQATGNTALAAILLAVDGLEALLTALNAAVATAAKQDTGNASLTSILSAVDGLEALATALNAAVATEATLATRASETTLSAVNTATGAQADAEATGNGSVISILKRIRTLLASPLAVTGTVGISGTVPVSAAALPLPSGAATEAKQDTGNTSLASILSAVDGVEGLLTSILAAVDGLEALLGGTLTVGSHPVTNAGTFAVQAATAGDTAPDAADAGNPVKIGGKAATTNPTAVADADRVNAMFDKLGRQVVRPYHVRELIVRTNLTLTSTTETTLQAAAAGTLHDLMYLYVVNTSGTSVRVDFRDDTAGTVLFSVYAAAGGGGASLPFPVPIPQSAANKNWTAQLSAAVTDVRILALFEKNPG